MREKVLVLVLTISLLANAYLVITYHPAFSSGIPGMSSNQLLPVSQEENSSSETDFFVDEQEELISYPPSLPTGTPDEPGEGEDGEGEEGENLSVPEESLIPIVEETEPVPIDPLVSYTSTTYGFSLRYPRTWTINEAAAGRTVLTLTAPVETGCDSKTNQCFKYIANFTVEIDQKPHTIVLEDYFNKAVSGLQLNYHITTTSKSAPALLSDMRSYQIEYYTHDKRGNADRSFMQYYAVIDGKGYILSYFGPYSSWDNVYDHNKADAQAIVDSFTVKRTFISA